MKLTDDMVADFMNHINDARTSTRSPNIDENQIQPRRTMQYEVAPLCGINCRLPRSGKTQPTVDIFLM